jgi:hypothetical protein
MTVYVDDMYKYPMGRFKRMKMSHMIADTDDELHAMAEKIGVKKEWFQGDHYDVAMFVRKKAIELGAIPISLKTLACMTNNKRI